jgi:hypothetical protein
MIRLIGSGQAEEYALAELHNGLGVVSDSDLCLASLEMKGLRERPDLKNARWVFFSPPTTIEHIPEQLRVAQEDGNLYVETDILGVILHGFLRREEDPSKKDRYGNFPLSETLAYKKGVNHIPYVDRLVHGLREHLEHFLTVSGIGWRSIRPWEQPLVCLTHDVDKLKQKSLLLYLFWLTKALTGLRLHKLRSVIRRIRLVSTAPVDPRFTLFHLKTLEEGCGFRSTFFLLSLPLTLGTEGRRYTLRDEGLKKATRDLVKGGWEIGLHTSRKASESERRLKAELRRLQQFLGDSHAPCGIRNHYLHASFPETWSIQENAGFLYDSTLGWNEESGFRAGTARPFQPFDVREGRKKTLWELPLVTMDQTLDGSAPQIADQCLGIAEETFKYNGCFTLLWHTDRVNPLDYPEYTSAYEQILGSLKARGCIGLTARDVIARYARYVDVLEKERRVAAPLKP